MALKARHQEPIRTAIGNLKWKLCADQQLPVDEEIVRVMLVLVVVVVVVCLTVRVIEVCSVEVKEVKR